MLALVGGAMTGLASAFQAGGGELGACCMQGGSCATVTQSDCLFMGGAYQGPLSACETDCPQGPGACCLEDGCVQASASVCASLGGSFEGPETECSNVQCPRGFGACCLLDSLCVDASESDCLFMGGAFRGAGSDCNSDCPSGQGACCFVDDCLVMSEETCIQQGGEFQGVDTDCSSVECPLGSGPCCLDDGSCVEVESESDCLFMGGVFQGSNNNCGQSTVCQTPDVRTELKAKLFGGDEERGKVTYRERSRDEGLDRKFIARLREVTPGELVRIYLNGEFLAGAFADEDGVAELRLRTPEFIDDPEDWDVMPDSFPRIFVSDDVIVGPTSGYFFDEDEDLEDEAQRVVVRAPFGQAPFVNGVSRYSEKLRKGELVRKFRVRVENGQPNAVLDILINGEFLGTVTLNIFGEGEVMLRSDADEDEDDMPVSFPSVLPGFVITVGPSNGAYALQ
jgi:hypothetical protein